MDRPRGKLVRLMTCGLGVAFAATGCRHLPSRVPPAPRYGGQPTAERSVGFGSEPGASTNPFPAAGLDGRVAPAVGNGNAPGGGPGMANPYSGSSVANPYGTSSPSSATTAPPSASSGAGAAPSLDATPPSGGISEPGGK